jgi:hypothetical protein
MTWTRWPLVLLLLIAAAPQPVRAQRNPQPPSTKDYRPLPYSGSLAEIFQEQMQAKGEEARVKELLNQFKNNPAALEKLEKLLKNPNVKGVDLSAIDPELLKLFLNKDGTSKFTPEQLKKIQQDLQKKAQDQANGGKAADTKTKPNTTQTGNTASDKEQRPDPLAKIAEAFVKKMDHSSLPEQYPAFGKFKDGIMAGKGADGHGFTGTGWEDALSNMISKSSKTNGGGVSGDLPKVGPLDVPGGGGVPEVPSAPFVPDLSGLGGATSGLTGVTAAGGGLALLQILLIVVVFVVVAVLVWKLLGQRRRHDPQMALAVLGPWPVDPARIGTREQLVQAFEYLALLLLGSPARTANHRDIADSLGTTPEKGQAADQLASLYEKARYDPVEGELPPADLTAARHDLLLLAGRSAPVSGEG